MSMHLDPSLVMDHILVGDVICWRFGKRLRKFDLGLKLERPGWEEWDLFVLLGVPGQHCGSVRGNSEADCRAEDEMKSVHTGYHPRLLRILASDKEHHIALAGVDVVVLEKEDLVDAVLLQRTELDEKTNRSGQRFLNDQVLLASNLDGVSRPRSSRKISGGLTYTFQQMEEISPCFFSDLLRVYRPHG